MTGYMIEGRVKNGKWYRTKTVYTTERDACLMAMRMDAFGDGWEHRIVQVDILPAGCMGSTESISPADVSV